LTDNVDRATRSRMMAAIRGKDTKPEKIVRRALYAEGFRYRLHVRGLPGRPDMVLPKWCAVIFVHGCFWHRHDCRYFRFPKTRRVFWRTKIEGNCARDRYAARELLVAGWRIATVWECAVRDATPSAVSGVLARLARWLRSPARRILALKGPN